MLHFHVYQKKKIMVVVYYLCQRGYTFSRVNLSVCLLAQNRPH